MNKKVHDIFRLSPEITVFPILNKSLLWSLKLKEHLLENEYDAIAVELPLAIKEHVIGGINKLPEINAVVYNDSDDDLIVVPIDPCEAIIEAIKFGIEENIEVKFVDSNMSIKLTHESHYPDSYSIKILDPFEYFIAMLPSVLDRQKLSETDIDRYKIIAGNLFDVTLSHDKILFVTDFLNFLQIKEHYHRIDFKKDNNPLPVNVELLNVKREQLYFLLGELPLTTNLFVSNSLSIYSEEFLYENIIKELVLSARKKYLLDFPDEFISITKMNNLLKFARNFSLRHQKLFPDLFALINSAKKVVNDDFALKILEVSQEYSYNKSNYIQRLKILPELAKKSTDDSYRRFYNYFDASPKIWNDIELNLRKKKKDPDYEKHNTFMDLNVSYPPEDIFLEDFAKDIKNDAAQFLNEQYNKVEKFSGSLEDGINLRETLRNLNRSFYVNINGKQKSSRDFDVTIIVFDQYNDKYYPENNVLYAEHHNESTISFFSTPFKEYTVEKGIYKAKYGGLFLIYPPRIIADFWVSFKFPEYIKTNTDKLIYGACFYSKKREIVYVADQVPSQQQKKIFKDFNKKIIYISLSKLSPKKRKRLQNFHLLKNVDLRKSAGKYISLD